MGKPARSDQSTRPSQISTSLEVAKPIGREFPDSANAQATTTRAVQTIDEGVKTMKQTVLAAVINGTSLEQTQLQIFKVIVRLQDRIVEDLTKIAAAAHSGPTTTPKAKGRRKSKKQLGR